MKPSEKLRDFGEKLKSEYQKELADEQWLAAELFDLYIEAVEITVQQWHLKPERNATMELMNRTFNDLYAGWNLIMEGMLAQGMTLLRDTIECANYLKLLEVDTEFRDEWLEGENFFLRDIRERMKQKGVSPPPQNQFYKNFSQIFTHPSKKGTASHIADWYPTGQDHRVLYWYGGVRDLPRTRLLALATLSLTWFTIYFLLQEMFPLDNDEHPSWHNRLAEAKNQIYSLQAKADQEWMEFLSDQLATTRKILDEYFKEFFRF